MLLHAKLIRDADKLDNCRVKLDETIETLLDVSAEEVGTGKRLVGYVCGCKQCKTAFENEEYDKTRPIGLLTAPDCSFGNVRVYTDTMELVKFHK